MEHLYAFLYYIIIFLVVFGVPIKHMIALIGDDKKLIQKYDNPEGYKELATIQISNMIFLFIVFFGFWLLLKNSGPGSFNGIMLFPFLIIYIIVMVIHEKKIKNLALNNEKRWK